MTTPYVPQPGSVGARVIARLQSVPLNAGMSNADLAAAVSADRNAMSALLASAMRHGLVVRERAEWGTHWRLGTKGVPEPTDADHDDDSRNIADPIARTVPATAAAPLAGVIRQSWCPAAQDAEPEGSGGEPETPPPPPRTPAVTGLGWKSPQVPVSLAAAPPPRASEPAVASTAIEQWVAAGAKPSAEVAAAVNAANGDPDSREVERDAGDAKPEPPKLPLEFWCALRSDGQLHIERRPGDFTLLTSDEARLLIRYVSETLSARARAAA